MKNTYNVSFKEIKIPHTQEIVEALLRIAEKYHKKFFIIGALARDIILEVIHKNPVHRATLDIDFAILLSNWHQYDEIINDLTALKGFEKAREKHRLIYNGEAGAVVVDILPFGDISKPGGEITWPPEYDTAMTTFGFSEVYENAIDIKFNNRLSVKTASLEGFTILKLVAWSDRKSLKDAVDLRIILDGYFDINADDIYRHHESLIQVPDFNYLECGARVLGRNIAKIIKSNNSLIKKITSILKEEISDVNNSKLAAAMLSTSQIESDEKYKENYRLLTEILSGIQD